MPGPILVPLDGSALAEAVLPIAVRLATGGGASLLLLQVLTPIAAPIAPAGFAAPYLAPTAATEDLARLHAEEHEQVLSYLEAVAARLRAPDLRVECAVAEGDPAEAIAAHARDVGAWLIAMSTHGRSGLRRWLFGSVAEATLRQATMSVLLIRPPEVASTPPVEQRPTVLVPLDGSPVAEAALTPAAELAQALRAPIRLLRIVPPVEQPLTGPMTGLLRVALPIAEEPIDREIDAERYLARMARQLRRRGHTVESEVIAGPPGDEIVAAAQQAGDAVVVMTTNGKGVDEGSPLGEIANQVLRSSGLPTVLVRPARTRHPRRRTGQSAQANR